MVLEVRSVLINSNTAIGIAEICYRESVVALFLRIDLLLTSEIIAKASPGWRVVQSGSISTIRIATAIKARPPETAVTTGVTTVSSRTGCPQRVAVVFLAVRASLMVQLPSTQVSTFPIRVVSAHMHAKSVAVHEDSRRYFPRQLD